MSFLTWLGIGGDKKELRPSDRERLRELEADMKQLRLEWEETYETVHRQLRKLGKRDKREGSEEIVVPESNGADEVGSKDDLRRLARAKGFRV